MTKSRLAIVLAALALWTHAVVADVRVDEKTHVEFAGMIGKMMNLFGGKAAREGVVATVAVKGDRKATMNGETGTIVDLAEEKVYDLDLKKKTYKVTTFDEMRRRLEEAEKKAAEAAQKAQAQEKPAEKPAAKPQDVKVEFDVDVKNTGQRKTINGFDARESMMTITVREKGKTLAQAGGMVLTLDQWLAPKIAAMKEVADFDVRYAKKMFSGMTTPGVSAEQMSAAMAMYPMMKEALGRMTTEGAKIDGTAVQSTMTMEAVKSDEQIAQEAKDTKAAPQESGSKVPTSVGGLLGGLAKRAAAKKVEDNADKGDKSRTTFMTTTTEILKVATDVPAADVAIPNGFKEMK